MTATQTTTPPSVRVLRVEIRPKAGEPDPQGNAALAEARDTFPAANAVHAARIYLIESSLRDDELQQVASELLADPVSQQAVIGTAPAQDAAVIEVHYLPGVMDPVAQSARDAIVEMLPRFADEAIEVRTGFRYDLPGVTADADALQQFAEQHLANTVIQSIHAEPYHPDVFVHGSPYELNLTHVAIRELDDDALKKLSREGHLFLSLDEMRAVQSYYRQADREPTDIELETLAQTWSEHCVHKTLKSTIHYTADAGNEIFENKPGHTVHEDGSVTIDNLLKSTVAAATRKLMESSPHREWCVSVFEDNAGIVRFDDEDGICIKVETHNHPSAIEPYGGAATGIGGCIRDVLGTGLVAKPIANTDTFCVAPQDPQTLPSGVIHPKRVLNGVVSGVRDYGNRMGIPTLNGAVYFHPNFLGNPLVFAGCVGILPLDKCFGEAQPGDRIIALGGRTGRDGIHGATFSSAELTDTHADEFSHAVQIGNAITEKKVADVLLRARDHESGPLFRAITDCGAGGFSSAIGEMGEKVGANVQLDNAPLKYAGLSYTEVWISEAQERMVLAVPPASVEQLQKLCDAEDVELCDLGEFGAEDDGQPTLVLNYRGTQVGRLAMHLLHDGIPQPTRSATWQPNDTKPSAIHHPPSTIASQLSALLAHPNIASKHWIIRQYDHEVQGGSVVKPLTGPKQDGPSDAAVLRPKLASKQGVAIGGGMAPHFSEIAGPGGDSYHATLAAIDEAVRNIVCVGADPSRVAILDNFCWPSCDDPRNLGTLVRAAEACYDGAMAYKAPFVSGKDSLNNQFTTDTGEIIAIPPTLLITAMSIVEDTSRCVTMDAKAAGNLLIIVGNTTAQLGGSHLAMFTGDTGPVPQTDLNVGPRNAQAVAELIRNRLVRSAHDCSDGGLLVAAAEMAFAGRVGLDLDFVSLPSSATLDTTAACFAETPSRYLLEIAPQHADAVIRKLRESNVAFGQIGTFADHQNLTLRTPREGRVLEAKLDALRETWLKPLDY